MVSRGRGYEIEDINQTLGRGTFNGRDVLEANDVLHVTVLTTAEDLVFARKYPMLTEFSSKSLDSGDTRVGALTGKNEKIPDCTNVLRHKRSKGRTRFRAPAVRITKETDSLRKTISKILQDAMST